MMKGKHLRSLSESASIPPMRGMTDEYTGYLGMDRMLSSLGVIKHDARYVDGYIHTNSVEGFWA